MDDEPGRRLPWWAQAALGIFSAAVLVSSIGLRRDWTPYVYPESAPSDVHMYASSERSLRECREEARLSARVWATGTGDAMAAICMRECWPFEGVVRPEAVRTINRKCRALVMVETLAAPVARGADPG